jgi:enoyl-CoA hydratase/carnithine racemase
MNIDVGVARAPIRSERPGAGVAVLFLDRPKQRNSLSVAMMAALHGEIAVLGNDPDIAAVVIAAEGPAFCAGHDLKELTAHREDADGGRVFFAETMARCSALMQAIVACPKPVIAAVHGIATAAGCQLVATCDLAVAEEDSRFATPGVNIGLFCSTPMVALARNIPRKRAMEMLLLGEMMGAAEAAEYGLINRVVAKGESLAAAMELARTVASKSPLTVSMGKAAFYDQIEMPLTAAYDYAAKVMVENMLKADAAEGISAFLDKRPPVWKGC